LIAAVCRRVDEDRDPGGGAVHGLLAGEEEAILDLIEQ
jgi:hypothetical protein